jgi:hypothetical protein
VKAVTAKDPGSPWTNCKRSSVVYRSSDLRDLALPCCARRRAIPAAYDRSSTPVLQRPEACGASGGSVNAIDMDGSEHVGGAPAPCNVRKPRLWLNHTLRCCPVVVVDDATEHIPTAHRTVR